MSDYLFDKEGEDADVEKLERSLGGLKYRGAAPELPRAQKPAPVAVASSGPVYRPRGPAWTAGRFPLAIAATLALCSGLVAYSAIKKKEADVRRGWNLVPVVVAAADISEGTVVTFDMISQRSVPEQFITSSVVKPDSASYVVNQKVLVPVQAGDPLLWSQFETTKAAERLSTKVQKKARAITIEAGKTTAVGGWVRPNDHVGRRDAASDRHRARHGQDHRNDEREPHPRVAARVLERLAARDSGRGRDPRPRL
jgi:hypothetical protein